MRKKRKLKKIVKIIFGIIGLCLLVSFVVLYCSAYIYNFLVTKIGGIKLRFEDVYGTSTTKDIKEITKERTKELGESKEESSETEESEEEEE